MNIMTFLEFTLTILSPFTAIYRLFITQIIDRNWAIRDASPIQPIQTEVTLVTAIEEYEFLNCDHLTSIIIPNSVTTIKFGAFWGCTSLTSMNIPNNVITIEDRAFFYCISLTSVSISNSITTIGEGTFINCHALTSVTLGNSITSIGENAFAYCHPNIVIHNAPWWFDREHAGLPDTAVVNYSRLTIIPRLMTSEKSSFDFRPYSCYRGIISDNLTIFIYLIFKRINRKYELAIQKYQANPKASPLDPELLPPIPVETVNLINSLIAVPTTAFPTVNPIPPMPIYKALESLKDGTKPGVVNLERLSGLQ